MTDDQQLLEALKRFARNLSGRYDVTAVLYELSESVTLVLGATASGVSLSDAEGRLTFANATTDWAKRVEMTQQEMQQGPCYDAFVTGKAVTVTNIDEHGEWPDYLATAKEVGVVAVAGIPMMLGDTPLGAVDIYQDEPRVWSESDLVRATVLADVATGYVAHASEREQMQRVTEQLEEALESRVYIEQAKGILAGERNITMEAAFEVLRRHARNNNASLRFVAQAVVELGLRPS